MSAKSSKRWLGEHFSDNYVKKAQQAGYRSRAVFKLMELQEREALFKPGMIVVELGAAPGGWSQYVQTCVQPSGQVIAVDILPMAPIAGVEFIQGDFTTETTLQQLLAHIAGRKINWVISDMAPNMSGNESIDLPKSMYLAELALDLAVKLDVKQGGFLVKTFQGEGFDDLVQHMKQVFKLVKIKKPKASRGRSREVYLLAKK